MAPFFFFKMFKGENKMTFEKYNNTKCKYRIMAKCRLCGEVFDVYKNDDYDLVMIPKDANFKLLFQRSDYLRIANEYIHYHEDGSYGLADFAGLVYKGEYDKDE